MGSPIASPTMPSTSGATLTPINMTRSSSTALIVSLEEALGKDAAISKDGQARPDLYNVDSGTHFLNQAQEQKTISQSLAEAHLLPLGIHLHSSDATLSTPLEILEVEELVTIDERAMTPEPSQIQKSSVNQTPAPITPKSDGSGSVPDATQEQSLKEKETKEPAEKEKEGDRDQEKEKALTNPKKPLFRQKTPTGTSGKNGKLRSNSPKPAKTSKLVTEEATEISLSFEEAERIAGMRILLAEDNVIAQKVLSKQLALFGLAISCANDGADALALFKAHPRGYYTMGFFDHHMPNCDGVQATQQIRALEKEHAAEVKGPVPRLPLVAVSADIQETARKACLNSGMERYVTKPLMQKDLVAMVRHYCVIGDAEASTLPYVPPPEGTEVSASLGTSSSMTVTSTVAAMVSAGHVSAPIGVSSALQPSMLHSVTSVPATQVGEPTLAQKPPAPKRDLELSPAALRGLALIRENTMQDESSKVGGGGNIKSTNLTLPTVSYVSSTAAAASSIVAPLPQVSRSLHHSNSLTGLNINQSSSSQLLSGPLGHAITKTNSSSSLSTTYHSGTISSPIMFPSMSTPTVTSVPVSNVAAATTAPTAMTMTMMAGNGSNPSSLPHVPGPITPVAAMAAGTATEAMAVASAAANTVSSTIHESQPSIYAAQGT
ncbi:histidine kinase osmosensor, partial [Gamsiella multidivaricata]